MLGEFKLLCLLVADREEEVDIFLGLAFQHSFEYVDGLLVRCIEDIAYPQQIDEIEVVRLDSEGFSEDVDGFCQAIGFEMFVDTLYCIFD